MTSPPATKGVGFFELGISYAESANLLAYNVKSGGLRIPFDHPIDFLYAHAFELMLEGCILENDPSVKVEDYEHRLLHLYDEVKSNTLLDDIIVKTEQTVKNRWRLSLRRSRDALKSSLANLGMEDLSPDELKEYNIYDNAAIGVKLPELRVQIIWLDARHSSGGSQFRYLKTGLDQRMQVVAFGRSDDTVWLSSRWASCAMYAHFRAFWKAKRRQDE